MGLSRRVRIDVKVSSTAVGYRWPGLSLALCRTCDYWEMDQEGSSHKAIEDVLSVGRGSDDGYVQLVWSDRGFVSESSAFAIDHSRLVSGLSYLMRKRAAMIPCFYCRVRTGVICAGCRVVAFCPVHEVMCRDRHALVCPGNGGGYVIIDGHRWGSHQDVYKWGYCLDCIADGITSPPLNGYYCDICDEKEKTRTVVQDDDRTVRREDTYPIRWVQR